MAETGYLDSSGSEYELPEEGVRELWHRVSRSPPSHAHVNAQHPPLPDSRADSEASPGKTVGCGLIPR